MNVPRFASPGIEVVDEVDRDDLINRLNGEILALQSVLYGLCIGLSRMSDVHREVVAQSFEYACAAPRPGLASVGEQGAAVRDQAFREAVGILKDAVTGRFGGIDSTY
jgi:hypothetical protein